MGALKGTHMCTPKGCTLYKRVRVRVYVKPRRGNFGHFTRDLGQNYRQVIFFFKINGRLFFFKINGHTSKLSLLLIYSCFLDLDQLQIVRMIVIQQIEQALAYKNLPHISFHTIEL